jgi:predicted acylesterase/phospholipase RssA
LYAPKIRESIPQRPSVGVLAIAITMIVVASGCTSLERNPVPVEAMDRAVIPGLPFVRDWGDQPSKHFQNDLIQSVRDQRETMSEADGGPLLNALLLSGGGSNGAFGAGFLNGWSETGHRPAFKLVTGISTGALTAPFAFLGPEYDNVLERVYTTISSKDVYKIRGPFSVLRKDSLTRTDRLAALIAQYVDIEMMTKIAAEHEKGRRLFVGTTNLDAQRLMVWNMGAIAASEEPGSLELFRKILLASASVPVAFPPVYFEVEVDGVRFDEMHVDGGVIAEFFLWGAMVDIADAARELGVERERQGTPSVYIIRNGQIDAAPELIDRNLLDIASRSMLTLIKSVAMGDLIRIWALAERDGVDFNYIGIPKEEKEAAMDAFNPDEMRRLFDLGHRMALEEQPWRKDPPTFFKQDSATLEVQ